jgi:hypothetical protein
MAEALSFSANMSEIVPPPIAIGTEPLKPARESEKGVRKDYGWHFSPRNRKAGRKIKLTSLKNDGAKLTKKSACVGSPGASQAKSKTENVPSMIEPFP